MVNAMQALAPGELITSGCISARSRLTQTEIECVFLDYPDTIPHRKDAKYWDINFCTGFPLLPPWRGKVGMGGNGWPNVSGCDPTSPPPSPSPVEGEGKKTSVQVLSTCTARCL